MKSIVDRHLAWVSSRVEHRPVRFLLTLLALNGLAIALIGWVAPDLPAEGPDVVDLELSLSAGVFAQIVGLWGEATAAGMRWALLPDFLFPIAYAALLSSFYIWSCQSADLIIRTLVVVALWAAAAFDYVENITMWWMLGSPTRVSDALVGVMSGAAIIKFALLTLGAGFSIAAFLRGERGRVIRVARYSVISLLLGTLPIIALDQGRDLLLGLADPSGGRHQIFFIAWMIVWAFSVWYWSRVLLDADADPAPSELYLAWARWLPRIAGFLTLLMPGIAFLIASAGAEESKGRTQLLGAVCLALAALFLAFVVRRRRQFPRQAAGKAAEGFARHRVSKPTWLVFKLSAAVSAVLFVWLAFFAASAGDALGAVAILTIVAANTVFFGGIAVFVTRARAIPVELVALACAAVFSSWNDNHDVDMRPLAVERGDLRDEFSRWAARAPRDANGQTPVIVGAAEGGGIRAALWTSLVLHQLAEQDDGLRFADRLFAISNVSGSSFGSAVYAGLRRDPPGDRPRSEIASRILEERFLAPMIAKLVSGDALQWFLPVPIAVFDRSSAMEEGFIAAYKKHARKSEAEGLTSMNDDFATFRPGDRQDVPVLLLNSTDVQLGRRVVASPYKWPVEDVPADERDPIDFHEITGRDVSLSTAAHNTARFPYISAAGRLVTPAGVYLGHIVDGGYYENTGADTLIDVMRYLIGTPGLPNVRFVVIVLMNSPAERQNDRRATGPVPWRDMDSLGELFAPFRTLLQTRSARGEMALQRLQGLVDPRDFIEFRVCDDEKLREAPLGWQLSAEMVGQLRDRNLKQKCFSDQVQKLKDAVHR